MASDFCAKHGLDGQMYEQLIQLLKMQMDGLLEKIDEVDERYSH